MNSYSSSGCRLALIALFIAGSLLLINSNSYADLTPSDVPAPPDTISCEFVLEGPRGWDYYLDPDCTIPALVRIALRPEQGTCSEQVHRRLTDEYTILTPNPPPSHVYICFFGAIIEHTWLPLIVTLEETSYWEQMSLIGSIPTYH